MVERGRRDRLPTDTAAGTALAISTHGTKVIRQPIRTSRQAGGTNRLCFRRHDRALLPPRLFGSLMTSGPCGAREKGVRIAGNIGDLWSFLTSSSSGVTLELVDGFEHFLCFDCVE